MSLHSVQGPAVVLPDIATCKECMTELFDPGDRRYLYPFINCTNCGPRFSIIDALPYDRSNTTMRRFEMCAACQEEYEDPLSRRFQAQPNACPACGPEVKLWDEAGQVLADATAALLVAVVLLEEGRIVGVKGLGGFHLFADATNDDAVTRLRERKQREEKPLAIMASSLDEARSISELSALEERALRSPEAPIVLLKRRTDTAAARRIAPSVAPRNPYLGVMLPHTPLHHLLMAKIRRPVIATSGNLSNEPICFDETLAISTLGGIADAFLVHDRPIRRRVDDSIVRVILDRQQVLRRARGYAPLPFTLKQSVPPNIAVGAYLKNTVALTLPSESSSETTVIVSQHLGDLGTPAAFSAFKESIEGLQKLYETWPQFPIADLHPDYLSSQYATASAYRVQHHCAHVASCIVDNAIEGSALGVAFDGAGYGSDGTIWGGEFIYASERGFVRAAYLRRFQLPGGDRAARNPDLSALGVLFEMLGEAAFKDEHPSLLRQMLRKGLAPRTSSAGRLFEAVAHLVGVTGRSSFEGQAATELEFAIEAGVGELYPLDPIARQKFPIVIDWEPMIRQILEDVQSGISVGIIAAKFHNTLAEMILAVALRINEEKVLLTGGCFQNRYLTEQTVRRLEVSGFRPYFHQRIPPNDGGIALGQVAAYAMENISVSRYQAR